MAYILFDKFLAKYFSEDLIMGNFIWFNWYFFNWEHVGDLLVVIFVVLDHILTMNKYIEYRLKSVLKTWYSALDLSSPPIY
jgi:hypothetical protein